MAQEEYDPNRPLVAMWDQCCMLDDEVKHRLEMQEDEGVHPGDPEYKNEDEMEAWVFENADVAVCWQEEWEMMLDALQSYMDERGMGSTFHAEVSGFGWRKLDGYADFKDVKDAADLLAKVLPNTDCTFRIYGMQPWDKGQHVFGEPEGFFIKNAHHDAPTGESYTVHAVMGSCEFCGDPCAEWDLKESDEGCMVCEYCWEQEKADLEEAEEEVAEVHEAVAD